MTIDIISYTDAQFAALSAEQILEVKSAQLKKNRLDLKLEEEMKKERHRLLENGTFLSSIWDLYCAKLQAEHDAEVETIRDSLLFYLRFTAKPEEPANNAPYPLDYSLTNAERYAVVRDYYEAMYTDPNELFRVFKNDKVALSYLGELYKTLYDYFLYEVTEE